MLNRKEVVNFETAVIETPIGYMRIRGCRNEITEIAYLRDSWEKEKDYVESLGFQELCVHCNFRIFVAKDEEYSDHSTVIEAAFELCEYFHGERKEFSVEICIDENSEFRKSTYEELKNIPYGETRTYGEIAEKVGNKKSSQAVGQSMKRNKIAILLPCHRVIGGGGKLTGYEGGLDRKKFLLNLEKTERKL